MTERIQNFSIELDSPPFQARPMDLFPGVIAGTGLEMSDFETGTPVFGNQMFVLKEEAKKDEVFTSNKQLFAKRINALYESGAIRYGSW